MTKKKLPRQMTAQRSNKLLYVASSMRHINNFHTEYISSLRQCGYDVRVMAKGEGADFDIPFEKKLFSLKNTKCRRRIAKIIKKEGFDAIILNTSLAAFHVRLACPSVRRPRIVNIVHGYLFSKNVNPIKSALLLLCEIIMRGKTDVIITMNGEDLAVAKKYKLCRESIYQSRGMGAILRPEITSTESIRSEFFSEKDFVMTFVGELSGRKNQKFLIEALPEIKKAIPTARLCLVGDGAERDNLSKLADSLGLSSSVILTGSRPDACDFIRASDLYVSASTIEGLPFNLVEALGAKKTVIASKIKGHTDLIEDGKSGYLFNFGDREEFVSKVVDIKNGKFSLNEDEIYRSYLKFEKSSVLPETLEFIKKAIKKCDE